MLAPLRAITQRKTIDPIVVETLECGHEQRFMWSKDRRGRLRFYNDKNRITSHAAQFRHCSECTGT